MACSVPGCSRKSVYVGSGLCSACYNRQRRIRLQATPEGAAYWKAYRDKARVKYDSSEKGKAYAKAHKLRYKSTPEGRAKIFLQSCRQNGYPCSSTLEEIIKVQKETVCYICKETSKRLYTDHKHDPDGGPVRHMLCARHNLLAQNEEDLEKTLAYVKG